MLDCKGLLEALSAYVDGEAGEELRLEIEEHLRSCVKAQAMLHTFRRTIVLHQVVQERIVLPPAARARLHEALRKCLEEDKP
ncbi:MAG: zf-HC2 domain-containing protein [Candidatus Eisenbacteria bacterium]|nr:zf-HC2 domain-containing protein [Candidatus Eisenbacteria bacterium]